jgi:NDP-sugar pyrophosphorylase family protein
MEAIDDYKSEAARTQIVMAVGGSGKRMGMNIPKPLIKLGDSTLLDRCVRMLTGCGFRDFIFLVGHGDKAVTEYIDGSGWRNVHVEKSYDYDKSISKGKAFKHALASGKIDTSRRCMMIFPDDILLDRALPMRALLEHKYSVKAFGTIASTVVARSHRSAYGIAKVDQKNLVTEFEEKPLIPLYATVGMYLFEPGFYKYALDMINLDRSGVVDVENVVLPALAEKGKVYAIVIPPDSWIPVNTPKELEQAQKLVDSGVLPRK